MITKAALSKNWTHSQWKRCWNQTAPQGIHVHTTDTIHGWELGVWREVPLPWQHQLQDTALSEASGSAHVVLLHEGMGRRQLRVALPSSNSEHFHQVAPNIFFFFF